MKALSSLLLVSACAALAACASKSQSGAPGTASSTAAAPSTTPAATASTTTGATATTSTVSTASKFGPTRIVKSRDGSFDGEVIGTPARNSKFSRLVIGMTMDEVTSLIGGPDNMVRHETGKRWIPFYFGNDAQRVEVLYRGEGCLTYTAGNVFGGGSNQLIRITATPLQTCIE